MAQKLVKALSSHIIDAIGALMGQKERALMGKRGVDRLVDPPLATRLCPNWYVGEVTMIL